MHTSDRARASRIIPAVLALVLSAGCSGDRPEFGPRPAPESDSGVSGEGTSSTSDTSAEGGATEDSSSSDTTTTTSSTGGGSGEGGSDGETTSNGGDDTKEPSGASDTDTADTDTAETDTAETDTKEPSGASDTDTADTDTADTDTADTDTADTDTADTDTADTETADTETADTDTADTDTADTDTADTDTKEPSGTSETDADTEEQDASTAPEPGNDDGERCGDGVIDEDEGCDEGNSVPSGGCFDCEILEGWECDGEPSECAAIEAPVIQSFLASAMSVPGGGGTVQLSWSVADADSLRIESDQPDTPGDVTGNMVEVDVQADTTFTLIADNEGGRAEESLTVEVNSIGEPHGDLVQFGSPEADSVADLAVQSDGSLYVVGSTQGDMDGENSGRGGAFIAKFSASGAPYWTRQISTEESTTANSVAVADDGSVYIAGSISGSDNLRCFLARYFDDGDLDWFKEIDDTGGGCAVAVYGSVPYLCSAPVNETRITAFSSEGTPGWSKSVDFPSSSLETVTDCVADAGGVYAVGRAGGSFSFGAMTLMGFSHDGAKLWSHEWKATIDFETRRATSFDGSLYVAATTNGEGDIFGTSAGGNDPIVARRSTSDGEALDGVQFGSSGRDRGEDVAVDGRGNILIVGSAESSLRPGQSGSHFVAKRTQDNQELWTRQFGPTDESGQPAAVVVAPNGTVVVAGTTTEELSPGAPGGGDAYLYIFK